MWSQVKRYFKYFLVSEPNPEKWLFIAGCPNSGTSLLHDVLASHPCIASLPTEGQFCTDQLISPYQLGVSRTWIQKLDFFYMDERTEHKINIKRLKKQWALLLNNRSASVLMEKSPTNTVRLRWLQKHFSNAFFIGIYRDGYAVTKGISNHTGCNIQTAVSQWEKSNRIMMEDFVSLNNKIMISYEEFTENTENTLEKITKFLSIAPIAKSEIDREYTIKGRKHKIENLNEQNRQQLTKEEIAIINREAASLLIQLGYPLMDH